MNQHCCFDKIRIRGTGSYVPSRIVANHEIVDGTGTSCEWIEQNLGVKERRVAATDEYTSDLAVEAARRAIASAGIDKNDIEMVIVATATPDRKSPSTACIVQSKLGISNFCPAFDLAAVCSGFLYAMTVAAQFLQSGACRHVLVIGADTFSKITDWKHRNCVFFGDGAGAVVMDRNPDGGGLFSSILFANGDGMDGFTVYPTHETFTMNGRAVYDAATTVLPEAIHRLLALNSLSITDIAMVVPHQPSMRVLRRTAELLNAGANVVQTNLENYANTAGATVPLLLDEVNRAGKLKAGDLVVFAAVGSGWTWGASLYRWI